MDTSTITASSLHAAPTVRVAVCRLSVGRPGEAAEQRTYDELKTRNGTPTMQLHPTKERKLAETRADLRFAGGGYMVWYGMVNVDLYSAIITKVSNALDTLVSGEKTGFQTLSEGLVVLLCAEVVRQRVPDHGAAHSECSASDSG